MSSIVSDLYFGKLDYQDDEAARVPGYLPALDEFSNAWDALRGALDAEERKLLVRLIDAHSALLEVSREEFFVGGSVWAGSWSWSWPPNTR